MIDIDDVKFEKLFNEKIAPYLMQFEQERKKCCLRLFYGLILCLIFFQIFKLVIGCGLGTFLIKILAFTVMIIFSIILCIILSPVFSYKKNFKKAFYKNLFKFFDLKHSTSGGSQIIDDVCDKSGIFAKYDEINVDDTLTGEYKGLPLTIIDSTMSYIYKTMTKRGKSEQTFFKGIFIATKINKNFKGKTIIKSERNKIIQFVSALLNPIRCYLGFKPYILEKGIGVDKSKIKNNIKIEDIEFEKHFEVYGDDQIEARYILTSAFIDRLVKYQKTYPKNIVEVVLDNDINANFNIYFFVNSGLNYFEIPIYKSLLNKDLFYNILKQLTELLDIIEALKLEQNIGL